MTFNLLETTQNYIQHINRLNDKLNELSSNVEFKKQNLNQLFNQGEPNKISLPKNIGDLQNVIYYITVSNAQKGDQQKICEHIQSLKDDKSISTKYPLVNGCNGNPENTLLYIGKSKGKLNERFRSHFRSTPVGTYALHMIDWINNEKFKHLQFDLFYESFKLNDEDRNSEILEFLESGLHLQGKPLLGRSGH